jgi:hypothetical protein
MRSWPFMLAAVLLGAALEARGEGPPAPRRPDAPQDHAKPPSQDRAQPPPGRAQPPPDRAQPSPPLSTEDTELVKEMALLERMELVRNLELFEKDDDAKDERQP